MMSSSIPSNLPSLTLALLLVMLPVQPARGGSGGVDEIMGEAAYSIPIVTPPGTAGTGPNLSLEYRSGTGKGGAGYVGFGWRIAGLSAIERDLKHGVPYDYETLTACGTALCYRDDFTLDGQDLFCADGSCSGSVYKTQQDDGRLITYLGETQGWEIQDRDGTKFTYGPSPDNRIQNPNNLQPFSWLLSGVEDVHGNWIKYHYTERIGVAYPSTIEYAQQGVSANRTVVFMKVPRNDHPITYVAGFRQELDQQITRIESQASGQLVAAYKLGYTPSPESQRSLLTSVQRIGSDNAPPSAPYETGQQPYIFSYSTSQGFEITPTNLCNGGCPDSDLQPDFGFTPNGLFDVNRDGLPDGYKAGSGTSVGLHNGLTIPSPTSTGGVEWHEVPANPLDGFQFTPVEVWSQVLDVDGDGYPDWVKPVNGLYDSSAGFEVLLGGAAGFADEGEGKALSTPDFYSLNTGAWTQSAFGVLQSRAHDVNGAYDDEFLYRTLLDMTGDGIPDYVFGKLTGLNWQPDQPGIEWMVFPGRGLSANGTTVEWSPTYLAWSDPAGQPIQMDHSRSASSDTETLTRDLNGDGLPDLIDRTETATISEVRVAYNNGAGFEALELVFSFPTPDFYPVESDAGCHSQDLHDLNGDGFLDQVVAPHLVPPNTNPDFIAPQASLEWNIYYGTGSGFRETHESWPGSGELEPGLPNPRTDLACVIGLPPSDPRGGLKDLNGDGLLDRYSSSLGEVYLNHGVYPDLMVGVASPGDASIDFDYAGSGTLLDESSGSCTESTCDTTQTCSFGACGEDPGAPGQYKCIGGAAPGVPCNPNNNDWDCSYCDNNTAGDNCLVDPDCGFCESGLAQGSFCEPDPQCPSCNDSECTACSSTATPLNPDLPFHRPVVVEMTVDGNHSSGPPIVSRYHYAGGVFAYDEKEFRGFGTVTRTDVEAGGPADGTDVVSTFATDRECAGRLLEREVWYDTTLYQREALTYVSNTEPEGWSYCLLASQTQTAFEGAPTGAERSRYTEWEYGVDPTATHYNVLEQHDLGEVDALGVNLSTDDDAFTYFSYAVPIGTFPSIVSRVSKVDRQDASGSMLAETKLKYDWQPLGNLTDGLLMIVDQDLDDPWATPPIQDVHVLQITVYDVLGNVAQRIGPTGFRVNWTYDSVYRTFPATRIEGTGTATPLTTSFSYAGCPAGLEPPPGLGLPCQIIDPRNQMETYGYDVLGRVVEITRRNGLVEAVDYLLPDRDDPSSPAGETRVTTTRTLLDATQLVSTTVSDGLGRVFQTLTPGKSDETIEVLRTFDDRGRLATETLPHFDTEPSPPLRTFYYDPLGRPEAVIDFGTSTQTVWTYDPWMVTEDTADPDPDSAPTREERLFDGRGRLVEVAHYEDAILGTGRLAITAEYDPLGRMTEVDNQGVLTSLDYDTLGRRVRIDDPDSGLWTFSYNGSGQLTERAQNVGGAAERTQTFTYDPLQRLASRSFTPIGNGSEAATFVYGWNPASFEYGRLTEVQSAGTSYAYEYDEAGRLEREEQTTLGRIFTNEYTYDELDRVKTRRYPNTDLLTHFYDGTRLVRIEGTALWQTSWVFDFLMSADYDALGRTTHMELGDTHVTTGEPDGLPALVLNRGYNSVSGRLETMQATDRMGGPPALDLTLDFDGLGRLKSLDGAYSGTALLPRTFEYDGFGRLKTAIGPWEKPEGTATAVTWDYSYDSFGNLTQQTSSGGGYQRTWSYTDLSRPRFLTAFAENGVVVDANMVPEDLGGNPASINGQAMVWNAQNRLHKAAGSQTDYHYDAFDRRTLQDIQGSGATQIISVGDDFEYDMGTQYSASFIFVNDERVISRATQYNPALAWHQTPAYRYVVRPLAWVALPVGAGLVLLGLLGLLGTGLRLDPPAWVGASGVALVVLGLVLLPWRPARAVIGVGYGPQWHGSHTEGILFYANDHLGSLRVVVDTIGLPVETRDYAPFGKTIEHWGDPWQLKHQFTGQPYDDTNGLQAHGSRMYDTRWGRWLSADEAVEGVDVMGLNPYSYVRSQPTSRLDRQGTQSGPVAAPPGPMRGAAAPMKFLQDALDKMGQSAIADQIVKDTKAIVRNGAPPAPGTKAFVQISVISQDQPQRGPPLVVGAAVQRVDAIEGQEPAVIPLAMRFNKSLAVRHFFFELDIPTESSAEVFDILGFTPLPEIPGGLGVLPPPKTEQPPQRSLEIHVEEPGERQSTGPSGASHNFMSGFRFSF